VQCRAAGPAVEQTWQDYRATQRFQILGLECWQTTFPAAPAIQQFIAGTGVALSMPLLGLPPSPQQGPPSGYGIQYDNYVIVDAQGIVRYTSVGESHNNPLGRFNDTALRNAIQTWLPTPVAARTWSALKELYR
jgi:hypothetical protein